MPTVDKIVAAMRENPENLRHFSTKSANTLRSASRTGGSDAVFKIPWPGDRRVNIQNSNGQAKAHQQRQVSCRYE